MAATAITVTVDEARRDAIDEVAAELRARGMTVEQVLRNVGVITGTIEDVDAIRDVPGILPPDEGLQVQLPPPDAEIQ